MADTLRAFIAIPLPPPIRAYIGKAGDALREAGLLARWVHPDNMHLTLRFLGGLRRDAVKVVAGAMSVATGPPLHLALGGLGVFPSARKARVLWMALSGDTAGLFRLQSDLVARLADVAGIEPEPGAFKAHVTLARFATAPQPDELVRTIESHGENQAGEGSFPSFTADRMVLYESRLTPGGPIYTRLFEAPFSTGLDPAPPTTS